MHAREPDTLKDSAESIKSTRKRKTREEATRWSLRLFQPRELFAFDRYQGKEIESSLEAHTIYQAQMNFVRTALETNLRSLTATQNNNLQNLSSAFFQYVVN